MSSILTRRAWIFLFPLAVACDEPPADEPSPESPVETPERGDSSDESRDDVEVFDGDGAVSEAERFPRMNSGAPEADDWFEFEVPDGEYFDVARVRLVDNVVVEMDGVTTPLLEDAVADADEARLSIVARGDVTYTPYAEADGRIWWLDTDGAGLVTGLIDGGELVEVEIVDGAFSGTLIAGDDASVLWRARDDVDYVVGAL